MMKVDNIDSGEPGLLQKADPHHWKNSSDPDEQIGLLVQELQKIYPHLVIEN